MKLITKEIEKKLQRYPFRSQEGKGKDAECILKIFNPYGSGTWLVTEAEKENDEWVAFGWVELFGFWELGYFNLEELQRTVATYNGAPIGGLERDLYCKGKTVGELMAE